MTLSTDGRSQASNRPPFIHSGVSHSIRPDSDPARQARFIVANNQFRGAHTCRDQCHAIPGDGAPLIIISGSGGQEVELRDIGAYVILVSRCGLHNNMITVVSSKKIIIIETDQRPRPSRSHPFSADPSKLAQLWEGGSSYWRLSGCRYYTRKQPFGGPEHTQKHHYREIGIHLHVAALLLLVIVPRRSIKMQLRVGRGSNCPFLSR